MEGNPMAGTMKNVMRGLAIATVPLTSSFPKVFAIYLLAFHMHFTGKLLLFACFWVECKHLKSISACLMLALNLRSMDMGYEYGLENTHDMPFNKLGHRHVGDTFF